MQEKKSKKGIFKSVIKWLLIVFILISALLTVSVVGLGAYSSCNTAYADGVETLYSFQGSNLTFQACPVSKDTKLPVQGSNWTYNMRWSFSDTIVNGQRYTEYVITVGYWEGSYTPLDVYYNDELLVDGKLLMPATYEGTSVESFNLYTVVTSGDYTYNGPMIKVTRSSPSFNCNIFRVNMGSQLIDYSGFWGVEPDEYTKSIEGALYTNNLQYVSSNNTYLNFEIPVHCSVKYKTQYLWDERSYYISNAISESQMYQSGLSDGRQIGRSEGYKDGYADAKAAYDGSGYQEGYNAGWQEAQGNEFSFEWFLTSTLSILDVDIFGVFSLGDVLTVSLGVMLVLIVLKLFAGG